MQREIIETLAKTLNWLRSTQKATHDATQHPAREEAYYTTSNGTPYAKVPLPNLQSPLIQIPCPVTERCPLENIDLENIDNDDANSVLTVSDQSVLTISDTDFDNNQQTTPKPEPIRTLQERIFAQMHRGQAQQQLTLRQRLQQAKVAQQLQQANTQLQRPAHEPRHSDNVYHRKQPAKYR